MFFVRGLHVNTNDNTQAELLTKICTHLQSKTTGGLARNFRWVETHPNGSRIDTIIIRAQMFCLIIMFRVMVLKDNHEIYVCDEIILKMLFDPHPETDGNTNVCPWQTPGSEKQPKKNYGLRRKTKAKENGRQHLRDPPSPRTSSKRVTGEGGSPHATSRRMLLRGGAPSTPIPSCRRACAR